jgi:hypothetical protein
MLLCLILAAAAAGRYRAEVAVRETRAEILRLERQKARAQEEIALLRAEIAYLESPERLAHLAATMTSLTPLTGAQFMTAREFVAAFAVEPQSAAMHARGGATAVDVASAAPVAAW